MDKLDLLVLIIMAFLPPIIYLVWIRNTEKFHREKWLPVFACFIWGATIAIIAALVLEIILHLTLFPDVTDATLIILISAIVIAPFVEEFTKPLVLNFRFIKKELDEIEDGFIYGAAAGLGFSATENLLYGSNFLREGLLMFFILITIRSFGGCLLHASATAWTGFGFGKFVRGKTGFLNIIPYFLIAVIFHAAYNAIASITLIGSIFGLILALSLAGFSIYLVRSRIKKYDLENQ